MSPSSRLTDSKVLNHLLNVSRQMAQIPGTTPLLTYSIDQALDLIGGKLGHIALLSDVGQLECKVSRRSHNQRPHEKTPQDAPDWITRLILDRVTATGTPLNIANTQHDPHLSSTSRSDARSVLCAPLITRNQITGAIYVENESPERPFTEQQSVQLEYLSHQAAALIENARVADERDLRHAQRAQAHKMEAIERLTGNIAHDIGNMLVPIISYVELAIRNLSDDDALRQDLQKVQEAANQATAFIRQILSYSRRPALNNRRYSLNQLVRDHIPIARRLLTEHTQIHTELGSALPRVDIDTHQIERVLKNLIVNAQEAMPDGGRILISTQNARPAAPAFPTERGTTLAHAWVQLSVCDTGPGIPPGVEQKIFEPLFTTKSRSQGKTGLGLSTAYVIVRQHGGHMMAVNSAPAQGVCFNIYLPASAMEPT